MKIYNTYFLLCLVTILGCDSSSFHQSDEAEATTRMKEKIRLVQAELERHCDSTVNADLVKVEDSVKKKLRVK